jgi:hypothetical protein
VAETLIRDVMRMLSPDRPIMQLARLAGRPRPTAKSWAIGHRRPPIYILAMLREVVRDRGSAGLEPELDYEIRKREYEPKHLTGFNEIREVTAPAVSRATVAIGLDDAENRSQCKKSRPRGIVCILHFYIVEIPRLLLVVQNRVGARYLLTSNYDA